MSRLQRRLRTLRNLELLNVALLPLALAWLWHTRGGEGFAGRAVALALVCWLLVQGGVYWHLKLRSVSQRTPIARFILRRYQWLKRTNLVLLLGASIGFPSGLALGWIAPEDALWALALTAFAWLEYLNYYHIQLAHDTARDLSYLRRWKRLRTAPLAEDLRRVHKRS